MSRSITLYSYEAVLCDTATWVARVAAARAGSSTAMSYCWLTNYGLKIEIRAESRELASKLSNQRLDVFHVSRQVDDFSLYLRSRLLKSISSIINNGLPGIKAENTMQVCSQPNCESANSKTVTICFPYKKQKAVCKNCIHELEQLEDNKTCQRSLVTPKLRFEIFTRDGFACCACGGKARPELGITLHLDHILPVAKGGKTVYDNLQTLCSECNLGKGVS